MALTNNEMAIIVEKAGDSKERKEKAEYPSLDDPNDHAPLSLNLPSLPSDNRQYRFLRLENGIKILLIHNATAVISEALLRVGAGSYDEPAAFPGLAHFLEHMLFMGSTKYPLESDYKRHIETHSGTCNANTSNEYTEFSFAIENAHFESALDRLAQFFISPLLKKECAEREIEAIEQEFNGKKEMDGFRLLFVGKKFTNPQHPESRFDFGNRETLQNLEQVLPELRQFYDEYYKANNITLILQSQYSLDEQERIARSYFSSMPKSETDIKKYPKIPRYLSNAFLTKGTLQSIQHGNLFSMSFISSLKQTLENEAALMYIVSLLANPSTGGLFDYLKSQGLITFGSLTYTIDDNADQNLMVVIVFHLAKTGLHRTDEIVTSTLNYISFLKQNGIKEAFFRELQDINELQLQYKASQMMTNLSGFMSNLQDYPLERFFLGATITKTTLFPEQAIKSILSLCSLKNLQQFGMQDEEMVEPYEIEPYTGAKFKRERASTFQDWHEPTEGAVLPFTLPSLSPYMPNDFSIKPVLPQFIKVPILIHNDTDLRVWLSQDAHFKQPSVKTDCYLISNLVNNTSVAHVCFEIFSLMFNVEAHRQLSRDLDFAGVLVSFSKATKGAQLQITGYADKHDVIIIKLFNLLKNFEFIEAHLVRDKESVKDELFLDKTMIVYAQALANLSCLFNHQQYTPDDLLQVIDNINIKTLQEYHQNFLSSVKIEVVCHGNMTSHEVIELGKKIIQTLNIHNLPFTYPQGKVVQMLESSNVHYSFNKNNVSGNALVLLLQSEEKSLRTRYLCLLLGNVLKPIYFDRLRTQKQLAYTAECNPSSKSGVGLVFVIESSEYVSDYLLEQTETFLAAVIADLEAINEEQFDATKKALDNLLSGLHHPTSPSQYSALFEPRFESNRYQFNKMFEFLKVSSEITLSTLKAFYSKMIDRNTCRQFVVQSQDDVWNEKDLMAVILNNLEIDKALKQITSIIFSYAQSQHHPYRTVQDISTFQEETPCDRDYMLQGERSDDVWGENDLMVVILNNLESTSALGKALTQSTAIIFSYAASQHHPYRTVQDISTFQKETPCDRDYILQGEQYIESLLEFNRDMPQANIANGEIIDIDEERVNNALQETPLADCSVAKESILSYCFNHYTMTERTTPNTNGTSCMPKMVRMHLPTHC